MQTEGLPPTLEPYTLFMTAAAAPKPQSSFRIVTLHVTNIISLQSHAYISEELLLVLHHFKSGLKSEKDLNPAFQQLPTQVYYREHLQIKLKQAKVKKSLNKKKKEKSISHTVKSLTDCNTKNCILQQKASNNLSYRQRTYTSNTPDRVPAAASRICFYDEQKMSFSQ